MRQSASARLTAALWPHPVNHRVPAPRSTPPSRPRRLPGALPRSSTAPSMLFGVRIRTTRFAWSLARRSRTPPTPSNRLKRSSSFSTWISGQPVIHAEERPTAASGIRPLRRPWQFRRPPEPEQDAASSDADLRMGRQMRQVHLDQAVPEFREPPVRRTIKPTPAGLTASRADLRTQMFGQECGVAL